MKSRSMLGPIAAFTILACVALAFAYDVKNKLSEQHLPRSGWVAGFHAYHAAGFDAVPVQVFSVMSEIDKGLVGVRVKNRSERGVTAVRLGWYLSEEQGAGAILAKGETGALALSLPSQQSMELAVPNITWEEILRPVMKNGTLRGDFNIWIAVSRVTYDDGSMWTLPQPTNVAKAAGKKNAHAVDEGGPCANQTCKKNGSVYQCTDGTGELCTNFGERCESSICGAAQIQ